MKLEPTKEQIAEMCAALADGSPAFDVYTRFLDAFAVIAPLVLEAAAQGCEATPDRLRLSDQAATGCAYCADIVRAMKGTP